MNTKLFHLKGMMLAALAHDDLESLLRLETELQELAWEVTGKGDGQRTDVAMFGRGKPAVKC